MNVNIKKFIINFFKDKNGNIIIAQTPNKPLWIALGLWGVGLLPVIELQTISNFLFIIVMLYWSYLEAFKGDNSFRKLIGIVAGIYFFINLLKYFI